MNQMISILLFCLVTISSCTKEVPQNSCASRTEVKFIMPEEAEPHEGTWLQWPHHHQYGIPFRNSLDATWVEMTKELVSSERVHIIAYDQTEQTRIINLLNEENISLENIDFKLFQTDDTWVRDNGPIFVKNTLGQLYIEDWGFNAWGNKIDNWSGLPIESQNCNQIPSLIALDQSRDLIDLNSTMINEGGSIEIDGHGTLMACKSSILNENRNPEMTQAEAEAIFTEYLGATHFIWLEGQAGLEITDQHIDGFARFKDSLTIITMSENDLLEFDILPSDIDILYEAEDRYGNSYEYITIPLTQQDVITTSGTDLGYKGSYINYYIANTKVLVPRYNDPNDEVALDLIQSIYPNRTAVSIDVRNLYEYGGMVHCVTQQQPAE